MLETVLEHLRDPEWSLRRTAALLELDALADALVQVRAAIEETGSDALLRRGETAAFLQRAGEYLSDVASAIELHAARADCEIEVTRALIAWQPRKTRMVLDEIQNPFVRERFSRMADAWDRSARALVHDLGVLLG